MYVKKAFTVLEMMIVMATIGVLSTILILRFIALQGKSRDSQRKIDLRTINTAVEIYLINHGQYPTAGSHAHGARESVRSVDATGGVFWIPALSGIIATVPIDPLNTGGTSSCYPTSDGCYVYRYGNTLSAPVNTYDLTAQLENRSDPDRCGNRLYKYYYPPVTLCGAYSEYSYEYSPHTY